MFQDYRMTASAHRQIRNALEEYNQQRQRTRNADAIRFETQANAGIVEKVIRLYSHGKTEKDMTPTDGRPQLVIIGGSPGVGKTSQARTILQEKGYEYDSFYHVSLDAIVERIEPYRALTKEVYERMTRKNSRLTAKQIGILSGITTGVMMSKQPDFGLQAKASEVLKKVEGGSTLSRSSRIPSQSQEYAEKFNETPKSRSTRKKATVQESKPAAPVMDVRTLRKRGLEYGIQHGFHILYDATFSSNLLENDIMPLLNASPHHYHITIILVKATTEQIEKQIEKRHASMIQQGYLRAIPVSMIETFKRTNRKGYRTLQAYAKTLKGAYQPSDVEFMEKTNRPLHPLH